ncbi:MAG: hypothetical protein ACYC9X_12695, partial [Dehalococcoidia bacterium]
MRKQIRRPAVSLARQRPDGNSGGAMDGRELRGKAAITGLGITEMGRIYGHDASHFAAEAVRLAVADAGLHKQDIDGLLVNQGVASLGGMNGVGLQNYLGLANLRLLSS